MSEWFNDEDFWKNFAPVMFSEKRWAEVSGLVDNLERMILPKGATASQRLGKNNITSKTHKILDLCCGLGRISTELARRGFSVTGVDLSATLLNTAREDAAAENLEIEYIEADARSFKRLRFFDMAINLYSSFGYFDDPSDDRLLLQNVYESLKPGGSFIIETLGKEIAVRDFTTGEWFERDNYTVLTEYEAVDSWSYLKNRWVLMQISGESPLHHTKAEKTFTQRLYAASELRSMFFEAGFKTAEICGGWDGRHYDQNAATLIIIGRK